MRVIDSKWTCWATAHNERYIVTLGNGITVWDRSSFSFLHHFTGVRWIHGGFFVDDDVLVVYTGEQKIFFFHVLHKELLWVVPRPRALDSFGDMHCCKIPGTEKVACIARGRKTLNEHYLLMIDWRLRELSLQQLHGCYRVVTSLVWTTGFGLTFLSEQAKGDNKAMLYRIHHVDREGKVAVLLDEESTLSVINYSGDYLFLANYHRPKPEASVIPLELSDSKNRLKLGDPLFLPITPIRTSGPVGSQRLVLPRICWIDEAEGILVACNKQNCVSIYDFLNKKVLAEYYNEKVVYGELIDNQLVMCCDPGFSVESLDWRDVLA